METSNIPATPCYFECRISLHFMHADPDWLKIPPPHTAAVRNPVNIETKCAWREKEDGKDLQGLLI